MTLASVLLFSTTHATGAFVQLVQATSSGETTATTISSGNFTATVTTGDLLYCVGDFDGQTSSTSLPTSIPLTDTLGNSFTVIKALQDNTNKFETEIAYAKNITGGAADSVTATYNGTGLNSFYKGIACVEYSGLSTTAPFVSGEDNGNSQRPAPGSGTPNGVTSNATPTLASQPAIVIGFSSILHSTNGPPTAGAGYTARGGPFWQFGTGTNFALFEDKRVTSTSADTATFTAPTSSTDNFDTYVVVFHEPAGASCTHVGITSAGAIAVPDGSSGSYQGKTGSFVTPDCSTVNYKQPTVGNFGVN
ncbi:MAG TPA: hypothetical protein VFX20_13920 [Steroidobacteraceae bacterium]|nr:hypothetical protein [Steroidobacteraceae bacterium]